jgi:predicted Zn-dependent protease
LSRDDCRTLFEQIVALTQGGGDTLVQISSRSNRVAQWARSRMHVVSETSTLELAITRIVRRARSTATTTRLDAEGLREVIRDAEAGLQLVDEAPEDIPIPFRDDPMLAPVLWDDVTHQFGMGDHTKLVETLMAGADAAGLLAAGRLKVFSAGNATIKTDGMVRYYPTTAVECSMTVRDTRGTASGWAGVNHYALGKIDPNALARRAFDKCQRMHGATTLEPGRYTVILEPQATADLAGTLMFGLDRMTAELGSGPFAGQIRGRSKIGERVIDPRLTLRSDPIDTDGAFLPYRELDGMPYAGVSWIDHGVLRQLSYERDYALSRLNYDTPLLTPQPPSFRLTPVPGTHTASVDEMIAKTTRGVLVTRLHGVRVVDDRSLLCTGFTRDGIWLIEHGKITRPVKNFRFAESPLFILNKLEDIGIPERVFAPDRAHVAPAIRVNDFNFISLADAV